MGSTPMYELQYLPLFYDDLLATVKYLSEVLHNPKAANKLIDDVENAILDRLPNAGFEPFHSLKERISLLSYLCQQLYRLLRCH